MAQLPLHGGRAPVWLFSRMVKPAREISIQEDREHSLPAHAADEEKE